MTALRAAEPELAGEAAGQADPNAMPWSQTHMLLAALTDAVRQLTWMYATVHSKQGRGPAAPEPIPRPGVEARRRKTMTIAAYREMTGQDPPLHLVQGGKSAG